MFLTITGETCTGTADHVAINDGTDYAITTCTAQALIANGSNTFATPLDRDWETSLAS